VLVCPERFEMVYDNYNGLVVGFSPTERPSDALFSIVSSTVSGGVRLAGGGTTG
jgi:hypothetical protein